MDLPLGWQGFPTSHWVQRRVPGARELVLHLSREFQIQTSGEVEEVSNANAVLVRRTRNPAGCRNWSTAQAGSMTGLYPTRPCSELSVALLH